MRQRKVDDLLIRKYLFNLPGELAKLPESERLDWQKLWAGVAATLALAQEKAPLAKKPDTK